MKQRMLHRLLGLVLVPLLLVSALTGFFRANYKWFWKENYKKIKNYSIERGLTAPTLTTDSILRLAKGAYGDTVAVLSLALKREGGVLVYDVRAKDRPPLLIDAMTAERLSPLSPELASAIAGQYVVQGTKLARIYTEEAYAGRKDKKIRAVYVAEYADPLHTAIYIDKHSGEIVEEADDNLRFGFWMVRLHEFDFWNTKRITLSVLGLGVVVLGVTGLYLGVKKRINRPARRRA
jgi:uncharacterized iron-regulated membrane protein